MALREQDSMKRFVNRRSNLRPSRQRGYVLVMTIAALALLTMAGAYISQQITTAIRLAAAEQAYTEQERQARDELARIIYTLSTTKRSPIGIGSDAVAIRLDGRWYDTGGKIAVSLQDGRGLVNLRTAERTTTEQLLVGYGIPINRTAALIDALEDYVDADSLRRLQGAEADDYKEKKLLPPRNLPLVSTQELQRVYGWKDEASLWGGGGILDNTVLADETGLNPATATWRTLVATLKMSEQDAKSLIAAREGLDAIAMAQLVKPIVGQFSGADLLKIHTPVLFPAMTTVITLAPKGGQFGWRATFTITPDQHTNTWLLKDFHEIALDKTVPEGGLPPLPDVSPFATNILEEQKAITF